MVMDRCSEKNCVSIEWCCEFPFVSWFPINLIICMFHRQQKHFVAAPTNLQRDLTVPPKADVLSLTLRTALSLVDMGWTYHASDISEKCQCKLSLIFGPKKRIVKDFSSCPVRFLVLVSIRPATRLHHDVVVSIRFPRSEFCGLQTPYLHILTCTVLDQLWHQADVSTLL